MPEYKTKARISHLVTVTSYVVLLLLLSAWHLVLYPIDGNTWVIWAWHCVPLLAFAHVVFKGIPRGHAWLCFMLLIYFVQAVLSAMHPVTGLIGLIYALVISTLFTSAMMFARWQSRYNKESQNAS